MMKLNLTSMSFPRRQESIPGHAARSRGFPPEFTLDLIVGRNDMPAGYCYYAHSPLSTQDSALFQSGTGVESAEVRRNYVVGQEGQRNVKLE